MFVLKFILLLACFGVVAAGVLLGSWYLWVATVRLIEGPRLTPYVERDWWCKLVWAVTMQFILLWCLFAYGRWIWALLFN